MQPIKVKHTLIKILFTLTLSITLNINLFPYVWCNSSERGFDGTGTGTKSQIHAAGSIGQLVTESAGYLIHSYSDTLLLLRFVEADDRNEIKLQTEHSISNLENATQSMYRLISRAQKTPYNRSVINKLAMFDYTGYFQAHETMNPSVWKITAKYLKRGDVKGIYRLLLKKMEQLHPLLLSVYQDILQQGFPRINQLWKLNQSFSNTLLLGQYVARVFSQLESNDFTETVYL